MARRKPFTLLAPRKGKRRFWSVTIRPMEAKRFTRSTKTKIKEAAREWAVSWIRENDPHLCRKLDVKPLKLARLDTAPTLPHTQASLPL